MVVGSGAGEAESIKRPRLASVVFEVCSAEGVSLAQLRPTCSKGAHTSTCALSEHGNISMKRKEAATE